MSTEPSHSSDESPPADLLERLRGLDPSEGLPREGEGLVVALSGGPDSVVLLDLLHRLMPERLLRLVVAHLDHGLRPSSADDARFCAKLSEERGIPFRTERVDVAALAKTEGTGTEAAGRAARYDFFERVRAAEGLDRVATGHHLDDHIETLLLWLFRGTGLSGMRGIAASSERLVRPLRSFRRKELAGHLSASSLDSRVDETNMDTQILRNHLRATLLPAIEEVFDPGAPLRLAAFARRAEGELTLLEELAEGLLERCRLEEEPPEGGVEEPSEASTEGPSQASTEDYAQSESRPWIFDRQRWLEYPKPLQLRALRHIAREMTPPGDSQRLDEGNFLALLAFTERGQVGKRSPLPGGGWLWLDRDRLRFVPYDQESAGPGGPGPEDFVLRQEVLPASGNVVTLCSKRTACFDADSVEGPLRLRSFEPGDHMQAFGMQGQKKLTELYRERGIPWDDRRSMLVLTDRRSRIIWAVGITTAEPTRITDQSCRILRVTLTPR